MKFTADLSALTSAIVTAARIVPTHSVRPALGAILINAENDRLSLTASDLQTSINLTVPAIVEEPGAVAIPGRHLADVIRHLPAGTVTAMASTANMVVSWGKSRFSLSGFLPEEYPAAFQFTKQPTNNVSQRTLRDAILHSAFAAATPPCPRTLLTGVQLQLQEKNLFALATDGFRVALYKTDVSLSRPDDSSMVVPALALMEVARLLNNPEQDCAVTIRNNQVFFHVGDICLATRILEGKYFAVLDMVPNLFPHRAQVPHDALLDACERVALVSAEDPASPIHLNTENGILRISATSMENGGAAEEYIDAQLAGDPIHTLVNSNHLIDGLRHIKSNNTLLEFSGVNSLIRITDPEGDQFQFMMMPLQMPDEAENTSVA